MLVPPPPKPAVRPERPVDQPKDHLADTGRIGDRPAAPQPSARVAEAQRLLARLGHSPGDADGVLGGRTEDAVRAFQQRVGATPDGRISDGLLARMRYDVQQVAARDDRRTHPQPVEPVAPSSASPGLFGTILAHVQRVVGPAFNGLKRPDQLRAYCREQPDTWVFDEGRNDVVYCGSSADLADDRQQRAQR